MPVFESRHFDVTFSENEVFNATFSEEEEFEVSFGDNIVPNEYQGTYRVTPNEETQTLHTTNKVLTQEIIIDPIPSNYGLITWNGSVITVS